VDLTYAVVEEQRVEMRNRKYNGRRMRVKENKLHVRDKESTCDTHTTTMLLISD